MAKAKLDTELEKLEQAATTARHEARELTDRARSQTAHRQQLEQELARRAHQVPGEFTEAGTPMPDTEAERLAQELAEAAGSRIADLAAGAEQRAKGAQDALTRHVAAHADRLAFEEHEGRGRRAVELMREGAALLAQGFGEYQASEARLLGFVIATDGLDGQDVVSDPRAEDANRAAQALGDLAPPRSKSLTPLEVEDPPRKIRAVGGGFVEASHLRGEDISPDQPERVAE